MQHSTAAMLELELAERCEYQAEIASVPSEKASWLQDANDWRLAAYLKVCSEEDEALLGGLKPN